MSIIKFEKREYQVITSCEHHQITIDRANKKITCRSCDIELDPFDEIMNYSDALTNYKKELDEYREKTAREAARNQIVARRLENKKKTKCHHCGEVTDIKIKAPTLWDSHEEMVKGSV